MKTNCLKNLAAVMTITGLTLSGATVLAQGSPAATTVQPAAANATMPPLAYGVSEVLKMTQAKVGDDSMIAYIKNSGNNFAMTANQIIYLHQQGVSDAVLNTMVCHPANTVVTTVQTTSATPVASPASTKPFTWGASEPVKGATLLRNPNISSETNAPMATYVQPAPQPVYYYPPYYYPAYGWYPPVAFSFGWGWGGGWHGGWHR